jgi:type IV pilus assembly protein PilA
MPGRQNNSFSLMELMVVIAIISILAAIAVPAYRSYAIKSEIANAMVYGQSLRTEAYANYMDMGKFAPTAPDTFPYYIYVTLPSKIGIVTSYYVMNKPDIDTYFGWPSGGIGSIAIGMTKTGIAIRNGTTGDNTYLGFVAHKNNGEISWQCYTVRPSNPSGAYAIKPEYKPSTCIEQP